MEINPEIVREGFICPKCNGTAGAIMMGGINCPWQAMVPLDIYGLVQAKQLQPRTLPVFVRACTTPVFGWETNLRSMLLHRQSNYTHGAMQMQRFKQGERVIWLQQRAVAQVQHYDKHGRVKIHYLHKNVERSIDEKDLASIEYVHGEKVSFTEHPTVPDGTAIFQFLTSDGDLFLTIENDSSFSHPAYLVVPVEDSERWNSFRIKLFCPTTKMQLLVRSLKDLCYHLVWWDNEFLREENGKQYTWENCHYSHWKVIL